MRIISCDCCSFEFKSFYGEKYGAPCIEIHHMKPIFQYAGVSITQTIDDALANLLPVCPNCIRKMENNCKRVEEAMNNSYDVEIVSINYRGKKMYLPNSKRNIQSHSYRNREDAREELCVIAKYFGCDMIFDFEYERIECEEDSDSGKGIHKYSEWSCSGIAVKNAGLGFWGSLQYLSPDPVDWQLLIICIYQ